MTWLRRIMQIRVVPRRYERTLNTIIAFGAAFIVAMEWLEFLRLPAELRTLGALLPVVFWTCFGLFFISVLMSARRRRRRSKLDRVTWTRNHSEQTDA